MEVLVHLQVEDDELPDFTLLRITAPDDLEIPLLHTPKSSEDEAWKDDLALTRSLGDAWLRSRRSALARVPSAILPATHNYLLNPLHPDAARPRSPNPCWPASTAGSFPSEKNLTGPLQ
jgi:RES domain-containing protein